MKLFAHADGGRWAFEVSRRGEEIVLERDGGTRRLVLFFAEPGIAKAFLDGKGFEFSWTRQEDRYLIQIEGETVEIRLADARTEWLQARAKTPPPARRMVDVRAPIAGLVARVYVKEGDRVSRGHPLFVLDAMKMSNEIGAPAEGIVRRVHVVPGAAVGSRDLLAQIQEG